MATEHTICKGDTDVKLGLPQFFYTEEERTGIVKCSFIGVHFGSDFISRTKKKVFKRGVILPRMLLIDECALLHDAY